MSSLDGKIPPPAIAAVLALAMWGLSRVAPLVDVPKSLRLAVAAVILVAGVIFSVFGVLGFVRARTTLNPTQLQAASSLVTSGIYRLTRNPMYLGLSCQLVALALFLACGWALLGPVVFMLYIGRFQIAPEERGLATLFGSDYAEYKSRVRRWL